jgi:hypothetical protein
MGSTPGPEMRLPAVIHHPTLLNRVPNRVAGGCKLFMVHPRGEGISFRSSLQTHAPTGPTPSLFDRSAGRSRKLSAEGVCIKLLAPEFGARFGRTFGSGDTSRAVPGRKDRSEKAAERNDYVPWPLSQKP